MTKAAAIYQFWSSFGLTAYEENTVPEDASYPYITYELVTDSFGNQVALSASIWMRDSSWKLINFITDCISREIGRGGKMLVYDGGALWLKCGTPFAQNMGDESDDLVKRKYLNLTAEFISEN